MSNTVIYRGFLSLGSNSEDTDVLRLTGFGENEWLAEKIMKDIEEHGNFLTVAYYITDREIPAAEVEHELIKTLAGVGDAQYHMNYSEITGYLYTTQDLSVGGHDLMKELWSHIGKFCHLQIHYSRRGKA